MAIIKGVDIGESHHAAWLIDSITADHLDLISQWDDEGASARHFTQASSSVQPRYAASVPQFDGRPGLEFGFGGIRSQMSANYSWGLTEADLYISFAWDTETNTGTSDYGFIRWRSAGTFGVFPFYSGRTYEHGILRHTRLNMGTADQDITRKRLHVYRFASRAGTGDYTFQIYVDGALIMDSVVSSTTFTLVNDFLIGTSGNTSAYFKGFIENIILYDSVQNDTQRDLIFSALNPTPTRSIWSFWDKGTEIDVSPDGRTLTGGANNHPAIRGMVPIHIGQKKQFAVEFIGGGSDGSIGIADTGKIVSTVVGGGHVGAAFTNGMHTGYLHSSGIIKWELTDAGMGASQVSGKTFMNQAGQQMTVAVDATVPTPTISWKDHNDVIQHTQNLPTEMFPAYPVLSKHGSSPDYLLINDAASMDNPFVGYDDWGDPAPTESPWEHDLSDPDVCDEMSNLAVDQNNNGRAPDVKNAKGNSWKAPTATNSHRGQSGNKLGHVINDDTITTFDASTSHFLLQITNDGAPPNGSGSPLEIYFGIDDVLDTTLVTGYRATFVTGTLDQLRLERLIAGVATVLVDNLAAPDDLGHDGVRWIEFDDSGDDPRIRYRAERGGIYDEIDYTDTDPLAVSGNTRWGVAHELALEFKTWDLAAGGSGGGGDPDDEPEPFPDPNCPPFAAVTVFKTGDVFPDPQEPFPT